MSAMASDAWAAFIDSPAMARRLQLASVFGVVMLMLFAGSGSIVVLVGCLLSGNPIALALTFVYLAFMAFDWNTPENGGRVRWLWFRRLIFWRYVADYFPIDLVRTAELPADRNYLLAIFPHGILSFGALANFGSENARWNSLFPGIRSKLITLRLQFNVPLVRELLLAAGMCSASARSLRALLRAPVSDQRPVNAAVLVVGGAQEALHARPDNYVLVLSQRKGFVRLALQCRAPIVPVVSFGEVDVYDQLNVPEGTWLFALRALVKRWTGVMPVLFFGRGLLLGRFGLLPRRRRITTVVGAPLEMPELLADEEPSQQLVDKVHGQFCEELLRLFEAHKAKYLRNASETFMTIL